MAEECNLNAKSKPLCVIYNVTENLAMNRTAYQSTTASSYTASRALDGEISTYTQTMNSPNQWWRADLGSTYLVSAIVIERQQNLQKIYKRGKVKYHDNTSICCNNTNFVFANVF